MARHAGGRRARRAAARMGRGGGVNTLIQNPPRRLAASNDLPLPASPSSRFRSLLGPSPLSPFQWLTSLSACPSSPPAACSCRAMAMTGRNRLGGLACLGSCTTNCEGQRWIQGEQENHTPLPKNKPALRSETQRPEEPKLAGVTRHSQAPRQLSPRRL